MEKIILAIKQLNKFKDKKYIFPVISVLAAILLATLPFILGSAKNAAETKASILSGTVDRSNISRNISGTGTLTDEEATEIKLPSGVQLKEYVVNNGDIVKAGDPLALVDSVSVMEAISSVQETMEHLEDEMASVATKYAESYITSSVNGTVKAVYAQTGDNVRDVMLQHGALALISVDGLIAVEFETDTVLNPEDKVIVIFKDRSSKTASVSSYISGTARITFADDGYELGTTVQIYAEDGASLGSGKMELNRAYKATAFTGVVYCGYILDGYTVTPGSTLFYISETAYSGEYDQLASQRREYEQLLSDLFQIYQDGYIKAPNDGIVWDIDKEAVETISSETKENTAVISKLLSVTPLEKPQTSGNIVMLSSASDESSVEDFAFSPFPPFADDEVNKPGDDNNSGENGGPGETDNPGDIENPDTELNPDDTENQEPEPTASYHVGIIASNGKAWINPEPEYISSDADVAGFTATYNENALSMGITFNSVAGFEVNDFVLFYCSDGIYTPVKVIQKITGANAGNAGGMPGANQSGANKAGMGSGGFGTANTTTEKQFELFPLEGTTIMTVTSMEQVSVTFNVDELDILSISMGQPAMITIDALPGQSFDGTVTKINTIGENRKYMVTVSFERTDKMLAGYNCSVTIQTETKENVLSVPVEAQTDIGGHSYLYTEYDKKEETLKSPVEIETGISDGEKVEIVSGINEGENYWYAYYDTAPSVFPFS